MNDDVRRGNFGCVGGRCSEVEAMADVPQEIISDEENVGPGSSDGRVHGDGPSAGGGEVQAAKDVAKQTGSFRPAPAAEVTP